MSAGGAWAGRLHRRVPTKVVTRDDVLGLWNGLHATALRRLYQHASQRHKRLLCRLGTCLCGGTRESQQTAGSLSGSTDGQVWM